MSPDSEHPEFYPFKPLTPEEEEESIRLAGEYAKRMRAEGIVPAAPKSWPLEEPFTQKFERKDPPRTFQLPPGVTREDLTDPPLTMQYLIGKKAHGVIIERHGGFPYNDYVGITDEMGNFVRWEILPEGMSPGEFLAELPKRHSDAHDQMKAEDAHWLRNNRAELSGPLGEGRYFTPSPEDQDRRAALVLAGFDPDSPHLSDPLPLLDDNTDDNRPMRFIVSTPWISRGPLILGILAVVLAIISLIMD